AREGGRWPRPGGNRRLGSAGPAGGILETALRSWCRRHGAGAEPQFRQFAVLHHVQGRAFPERPVYGLGPGDLRHGAYRCHSARRAAGTARRDELGAGRGGSGAMRGIALTAALVRSEEHTSELQSRENLVCRLLLEKKNKSKEAK